MFCEENSEMISVVPTKNQADADISDDEKLLCPSGIKNRETGLADGNSFPVECFCDMFTDERGKTQSNQVLVNFQRTILLFAHFLEITKRNTTSLIVSHTTT